METEEKKWISLHQHTCYSQLDGLCKLDDLVGRAQELGMNAIAITDHNHLGGTFAFQKVCKDKIKPILGYEAYYTDDTNILSLPAEDRNRLAADKALEMKAISDEEYNVFIGLKKNAKLKKADIKEKIAPYLYNTKQYHIIFLAMNQEGWQNIIKLQSRSAEKCTFNGRFLCDNELIRQYSEGVICTTACIANRVASLVNSNDYAAAENLLLKWKEIFGDRFYLEIQPLSLEEQVKVNAFYIRMASKHSLPIVATNDVHYVRKSDHFYQDVALCIGTGAKLSDPVRMRYSNDFWLRSYDEMIEAFTKQLQFDKKNKKLLPDNYLDIAKKALAETCKVADRIDADIKIGSSVPLIPQVKLKPGETAEWVLRNRCFKGLYALAEKDQYVKDNLRIYEKRIDEELKVIIPKGFASYLLVVDESVTWANNNGIVTGPGRGSAAGSLCLYLLGITKNIDPIKHQLLFSRFLTKDRTAMPDIDTDYSYSGRQDLISHLEDYYGKANVSHIGVWSVLGVKSGIKDVGRVLSVSFEEMNEISKAIDAIDLNIPQPKFKDYDNLRNDENPGDLVKWQAFHKLEEENSELFEIARALEGLPRQFGVHASGILATPCEITNIMPTRVVDGVTVCLYTGPEVEELNCVKLDVLGLRNLDVIDITLKHIDKNLTIEDLYNMVDVNDPNIYKMLCDKRTDMVFQLESDMFKGLISDIKPNSLNDITAITSLGRPGPLSAQMHVQYARRKNGQEEAVPILRGMEEILGDTYGEIIFQEQIMLIGVKALGFNMNQADGLIRKIFAKKKKDKMEMLRRMMKYGSRKAVGPEGWHDNPDMPWYDPKGEYGDEIKGGIANGYSSQEMDEFWNTIQGFCDYLFNKSHAACYSYISILTAWLKCYYPTEFMAAVLSVQDESKIDKYAQVCENEGIKIRVPDINASEAGFTPDSKTKTIYYGLASVKGVGETALGDLINNRPYNSLEEVFEKVPKRAFNKRVAIALAKAGALDSFDNEGNRNRIINKIYELRKEKNYEPLNEDAYCSETCIEYETEVLSAPISVKPWWQTVKPGDTIMEEAFIASKTEKIDKNNNLMLFTNLCIRNCVIESVVFASVYRKCVGAFNDDLNFSRMIVVKGKKDEKGKLIVKSVEFA